MESLHNMRFSQIIMFTTPRAMASLQGNVSQPQISGSVWFYPAGQGTLVVAEVFGLPTVVYENNVPQPAGPFYGFHIHSGEVCEPRFGDAFAQAGGHLNPTAQPHPQHMGDMPPLLSDKGYAYMTFYTERFIPQAILGKTVIIHQNADDFRTQPAGNAGNRLACGVIQAIS